jgi:hypothetical protein
MVIRGQMARVPVTARQKFNEAAYFYNGMLANRSNVVVFPYYLSAFLSALRSVTWYLQKQYADDTRFAEWYAAKQTEMKADKVLTNLNQKRVSVVHQEPFDLHFTKGFKMPAKYGAYVETTHFELRDEVAADGKLRMSIVVGPGATEEAVTPWINWHFSQNDPADVMHHCYAGLEKMNSILTELATLRLGMGLSADEDITTVHDDLAQNPQG